MFALMLWSMEILQGWDMKNSKEDFSSIFPTSKKNNSGNSHATEEKKAAAAAAKHTKQQNNYIFI